MANCARHTQGLNVEFTDLTYKVNKKTILDGVSGRFRSGHLSAVMGPSGAGKTSLLNILSGFISPLCLEGTITVGGEPRNLSKMRQQSCYITQEFTMLDYLTVRETLHIASCLKLPATISNQKKHIVVEEVASTLGLVGVLDSYVHSLSGGEKKRVSIGLELVTNPPIMFCDEPTSGLDSFSSFQVMTHLQSLAMGGRTIIVVIHSPSSRLLELIDDLFMLAEGRCIYNGTLKDLLPTLEAIGLQCPQYYNRADFALEVACKERGDHIKELVAMSTQKHNKRAGSFYEDILPTCNDKPSATEQSSMLTNGRDGLVTINLKEGAEINIELQKMKTNPYAVSRFTQLCILFRRSTICNIRDLRLAFLRLAAHILVALLLGVVYYDFGNDGAKVSSNFSCIFFIVLFHFYGTAMHTVLTFPMEANVIVREHFNNWYALSMYYLAKVLGDLPFMIFCPVLFLSITYYLTGQLLVWDRFLMFLLISIVLTILAQTIGCAFGVVFQPQLAIFLVASCTMPMFLISGFFIHLNDLSPYMKWLSYFSIFRYSLEAAAITVFGLDRKMLGCSEDYCHFRRPKKFLEEMGLENGSYWVNVAVLCFAVVISQIALYFMLRWKISRGKIR
uniref:ABC transporter domain-containing protein n=1 Tax=Homalodisca liturata TaxID=320908 RepID=A0A1B6IJC3_9HEMI